jgi:hypothetical protein
MEGYKFFFMLGSIKQFFSFYNMPIDYSMSGENVYERGNLGMRWENTNGQ